MVEEQERPEDRCLGNIAAECSAIDQADREDCLHFGATKKPEAPASSGFISIHELLLTQAEPPPGDQIRETILRDFCSSPTYSEEVDTLDIDAPPWFRFRHKKIKTYPRKRRPPREPTPPPAPEPLEDVEDDRLSCSSGLSVEEYIPVAATTSLSELSPNTSQKICENLLNLSVYFSLSNPSKEAQINLPALAASAVQDASKTSNTSDEILTAEEIKKLEDDLLQIGFIFEAPESCDNKPKGDTLFGESKVCPEWSEGDSFLDNYNTEQISLNNDEIKTEPPELKAEPPEICPKLLLDDIPISEWQTPMDIPDESIKEETSLSSEKIKDAFSESKIVSQDVKADKPSCSRAITDEEFLEDCHLDEWHPVEVPEFVGFRTASNKDILISEETKARAAKLMADIEVEAPPQPECSSSDFVGFRTASNKAIEISEETKQRAAKLMADIDVEVPQQPECNTSEFVGFRTASNKTIKISEETKQRAAKLMADIDVEVPQQPECNSSDFVGFRTASNKTIKISEETKKRAAKLMADIDVEAPEKPEYNSSDFVGFRTASNKAIEISEETKQRAAKLMADIDVKVPQQPECNSSEFVGFRTASNKTINISEETKKRAANLMADIDVEVPQKPECNSSDFVGFRTASNKAIEISEETKQRAAKLMADIKVEEAEPLECQENPSTTSEFVGFRTASNKRIEITEAMETKGAMFLAQFKEADKQSVASDSEFLEDIVFSQWEPLDITEAIAKAEDPDASANISANESQSANIPQLVAFHKTKHKFLEISQEMRLKGDKLIAEVVAEETHPSSQPRSQSQRVDASPLVGFRTASNKRIEISEEMQQKAAKLIAEVAAEAINQENVESSNKSDFVGFRTASNKAIVVSEEMQNKAAKLMADVQAECLKEKGPEPEESVPKEEPPQNEEFVRFHNASNKCIQILDEMRLKAERLMSQVELKYTDGNAKYTTSSPCQSDTSGSDSGDDFKGFPDDDVQPMDLSDDGVFPRPSQENEDLTPKARRETSDGIPSSKRRRINSVTSPQQSGRPLVKTISCHSALGTPTQSQEIHASLTQLANQSPLDKSTKTSVIARKNLLTLSRKRKQKSAASTEADVTPLKPKFAPAAASTSTPLAAKNTNLLKDSTTLRLHGEDMSPICMPPNKSRRLGLSRSNY